MKYFLFIERFCTKAIPYLVAINALFLIVHLKTGKSMLYGERIYCAVDLFSWVALLIAAIISHGWSLKKMFEQIK